ncbi:MAG: DHHA1 domain-containing protein [Candidatus Paceibacterota bacterium]|jgi:oligoribonuclease NrnB/cAMP/cGMP phosphodiesterase (DHH superfamily)
MSEKQTVILYHGGCPDGFGSAYAAWKKFGDTAEYIPLKLHERPIPEGLEGKHLFFIDFTYPQDIMDEIVKTAASVTVLDHHLGIQEVVESMPDHVFDEKRSGATIAWSYFHPDVPIPFLLKYVEDADRYVFLLPDSRAVIAYAYAQRFTFEDWDHLVQEFENEQTRATLIEKGKVYAEYFAILVEQISKKAILVSFEGHTCYLSAATDMFKSDVGNNLAHLHPPLAIIANLHGDVINVSLRSDSSVDVSVIARKYGGNGHPHAAAFRLKWGDPLPWVVLDENENPSH